MLKRFFLTAFAAMALSASALAAPIVGQPAPDFTGTDTKGQTQTLSQYKGRTVVLEWTNAECPYVKKHYGGNMQATQEQAAAQDAIWLRVNSSAPGKQGHLSPIDSDRIAAENHVVATATILDESGEIGKLYDAKTTPHMFVIDKDGVLVYAGAIDDKPTADSADIATAKNYVRTVLDDLRAGRPVSVAETKPYGCGVKYAE